VAVAGNNADDPLYIPEIRKVQRAFGMGGKTRDFTVSVVWRW
jgi:hypothetical protein